METGDSQSPPASGWDQRNPKDEDREPQDICSPRMGSEDPTISAVPGWDQRNPKDEDRGSATHHQTQDEARGPQNTSSPWDEIRGTPMMRTRDLQPPTSPRISPALG